MLCHLLRVSGSARDLYSAQVCSLNDTIPEVSTGSRGRSFPPGISEQLTGRSRTIRPPRMSRVPLSRASKSAVQQWFRFLGSRSSVSRPSRSPSHLDSPFDVRQ